MTRNSQPLWASGPGEILRHGLDLLKQDSDTKRRLAMISIDNAVELMMKIYLGLPKRITGLEITRKDFQEFSESFPKLLDALEKHAADKLDGIDLGEIEWFHRLRNELYHQGNGLTVERDKVEVYAELANILFSNLFGFKLVESKDGETDLLGSFITEWVSLERILVRLANSLSTPASGRSMMPLDAVRRLFQADVISKSEFEEIEYLRKTRNEIVHGMASYQTTLTPMLIERTKELASEIEGRIEDNVSQC